jgi:cation transport ATPase
VGMKKRLVISVIFLVPLMIFSMGIMFVHGNFSMHYVALIQFLLLLPILWVNRKYFIVGFKMLFKGVPNMDTLIALGSTASTVYGVFVFFMPGNHMDVYLNRQV